MRQVSECKKRWKCHCLYHYRIVNCVFAKALQSSFIAVRQSLAVFTRLVSTSTTTALESTINYYNFFCTLVCFKTFYKPKVKFQQNKTLQFLDLNAWVNQDRPRQTRTDLEYLDYLEYLGYMEYHEYSEYLERGQFHHFYDVSSDSYISRSNILPITFSQFPCLVYPKRVVCKTLGLVRLHLSFALLSRERKNPCHCAAIHFHSAQQQIFSLCCPILRHGYCWLRKS